MRPLADPGTAFAWVVIAALVVAGVRAVLRFLGRIK